jgi:hypothetical protein
MAVLKRQTKYLSEGKREGNRNGIKLVSLLLSKISKAFSFKKKERKYTLVSLNVKKLVYEIYAHFQW